MSTFVLRNFGCRANQADGAAMAAALLRRGWQSAAAASEADWAVLNSCTVTAEADRELRRAVRRLQREAPRTRIAVTGCYAQRAPEELAALGIAAVVGHGHIGQLASLLSTGLPKLVTAARLEPSPFEPPAAGPHAAGATPGRTRVTLKVQEGCGRRCSFCIIPFVRGAPRSRALGVVLAELRALAAVGVQEAVISGINLGQWGRDLDQRLALPELVSAILEQTALPRLRLSSIEPMDWMLWGDRLTPLLARQREDAPRLARHFHLPLQSGSDAVLRRMHRRYRAADYAAIVASVRRASPAAAIGADVMVGFPGESEAEFLETRDLVAALPFTYLHIFTFSRREGTEAARRLQSGEWKSVPERTAAGRARELRRMAAAKHAAFLDQMRGRRLAVVTLQDGAAPSSGHARGLSDNFLEIALDRAAPANRMLTVEVTGVETGRLVGRVRELMNDSVRGGRALRPTGEAGATSSRNSEGRTAPGKP